MFEVVRVKAGVFLLRLSSFRVLLKGLPVASLLFLLFIPLIALQVCVSDAAAVEASGSGNVFHVAAVRVRVERLAGESNSAAKTRVHEILTRANRDLYSLGLFTEAVAIDIEDGDFEGATLYDVLRESLPELEGDTSGAKVLLTIVRAQHADRNYGLAFTGSMCRSGITPMVLVSSGADAVSIKHAAATWAHEFAHTVGLPHDDTPCSGPNSLTDGGFPLFTLMATRATQDNCGFSAGQQQSASQLLSANAGSCLPREFRELPALSVSIPESVEQREGEALDVPIQVQGAFEVKMRGIPIGGYYDSTAGVLHLPALTLDVSAYSKGSGGYSIVVEILPMAGDAMRVMLPVTVIPGDLTPRFDHGTQVMFTARRGKVHASVTALDDGSVSVVCSKPPRGVRVKRKGNTMLFSGKVRRASASLNCWASDAKGQVGTVAVTFVKTRR